MIAPWNFRPENEPEMSELGFDVDGESLDWEDNWLSNSIAWASQVFTPNWCDTEEHWTSRIANYLWAECPCCLFYRGAGFGAITTLAAVGILGWLL